MKGDKWFGKCIYASDTLTIDKVYEVEEDSNSNSPMRGVNVLDDEGNKVCMFASRFERTNMQKPAESLYEKAKDPQYIIVHTTEKFINVGAARLIKKKTLRNIISRKCEQYIQGNCSECFTEAQELEYGCFTAWSLTIGKGKKIKL